MSFDELLGLACDALKKEVTKKILKTDVVERSSKGTNIVGKAFSNQSIRAAAERSEGRCEICKSTEKLQKDHRIPRVLGGLSTTENCRILCRTCNIKEAMRMGIIKPGQFRKFNKSD